MKNSSIHVTETDMKHISKEHILVLGGSGGIGSDIVRAFAQSGAEVISFTYSRNKTAADELASELRAKNVKVHYASLELTDVAATEAFLEGAVRAFGREVSIAVNSVGISPNVPLMEQTAEQHEQVFKVNTIGSFFAARTIAARMKASGVKGSIVLITSTNGINSQSQISAHYDGSKAAQSHQMRILAEFFAPDGIRINGVAPGWVSTSLNNTLPPKEREKESARIWSGRWATPAEIANVVLFIASQGGSYIIGQDIMVDGGYR